MNLSIIIPTWNTASITYQCLLSIIKHLKSINYEIIVIDNASTDKTIKNIKSFQKEYPSYHLSLITNHSNVGFSKANNIGVKQSKREYLFFLNSDMKLIDNSLQKMLIFLKNNPNIGLIGPQLLNPDKTIQASVFPPQTSLNAFREFWLNQKTYSKYIPMTTSPIAVHSLSGGALLIKKNIFKKIGNWNEKYFMYFEDLDLCRQIKKLRLSIYYYPKCKIIHYHGVSGKSLASSSNQWRRLIPSSKIYHGIFKHYLINFIIWSGQKWQKILKTLS